MSGIFDRRAKRFISTEQAERAVPSRTVMASRVARDDVNHSERVQKKEDNIQMDKDDFLLTQIDEFREKAKRLQELDRDISVTRLSSLLKRSLHQTRLQLSSRQQQINSLRQRMTQRQMLSQQQLLLQS